MIIDSVYGIPQPVKLDVDRREVDHAGAPLEKKRAQLQGEAAALIIDMAGDGTTTSTVTAPAIN